MIMKKVFQILALIVFTVGLFSCEAESTAETQDLYEIDACDGCSDSGDERDPDEDN